MPILRIDVPEGLTREQKATLQKEIRRCVELTWAKEHVYIAIRDMFSEPGDRTTIMTMDLRPGRGHENERAEKLYAMALEVLKQTVPLEARDFVMLIQRSARARLHCRRAKASRSRADHAGTAYLSRAHRRRNRGRRPRTSAARLFRGRGPGTPDRARK